MASQSVRQPSPKTVGEIAGLPATLPAGAVTSLFDGGRSLALAVGNSLIVYDLQLKSNDSIAKERTKQELPGLVCALAASSLGLVVAVERGGRSSVLRLQEHELVRTLEIPGKITALAAAGSQAFVAIQEGVGFARLVQINLRQRAIVATRQLEAPQVKLAADLTGRLVVSDQTQRKVFALGADLRPELTMPAATRQAFKTVDPERHDSCCVCLSCKPLSGEKPARRPEGGDDAGQPQRSGGGGHDGHVGVPSDNGGAIVADGDKVHHHPHPGSPSRPCGRRLAFGVEHLSRVGAYVLASDRKGRRAALLSADMNMVAEWQFSRTGALLLTADGAPALLMHQRDSGRWRWLDVHDAFAKRNPHLELFPVIPQESKTFVGQQTYALSHGQAASPTSVKAVIFPVIEGSQSYTSANLAGFGAFVQRTVTPLVKDYYDENSFGALKDVSIDVFGVSVGPGGGPLKLPRPLLSDYFFPAYDAAKVELVKNAATGASAIVLDGRESLSIDCKTLTGGPPGGTVTLPFFALAFQRDDDFFPFQLKFLGTESMTLTVKTPAGLTKVLNLVFPAKTIDILDIASFPAGRDELRNYLDGVMQAAETAAGLPARLFATPEAFRIPQIGKQFGRLLVTFRAADLAGVRMSITATASVLPGGDPMGLAMPITGTLTAGGTFALDRYLENAMLLAQEAGGFGYNGRLFNAPTCVFDAGASTLKTTMAISDRYGGPGAEVKLVASSGLEALFDTATPKPNSATTLNDAQALRDRSELYRDVFSAAIDRLRASGMPTDALKDFGCAAILPVEPPDLTAVFPSEVWNVTPLATPFSFRGAENVMTVIDRTDDKVQLQSAWTLIFMTGGQPDYAMICHELGHALGYADLYYQTGYRDELGYMGDWAMMDRHPPLAHHCGYHKLQSGWIPDGAGTDSDFGRVYPISLPDPAVVRTWDLLLVPVELWRDSLVQSARVAFAVGNDVPVIQLAWIDFGGDGATFGLIEARQPGAKFSKSLPGGGGVLITNGIAWTLDQRFATNTWYRRPLHLLNPNNILRNAGDKFDLARAPELPLKGTSVEVVDKKIVEGDAEVYRIRVSRENAEFVDLYFSSPDVYYKNPDLWIDWAGNNAPPDKLFPDYQVGEPVDQGETVWVPSNGTELHWVVARLRNRGQVKALDVKLNFYYFEPPGAGDGRKPMDVQNLALYKLIGSITVPEVPPLNDPQKIKVRWDVPAGFGGHTCLLVQIEDYKIPADATGALGSDDVWQANNHAQKNVDKFEALSSSPFGPIEFDFSVRNEGVTPEKAYLEPDGLPHGMRLTVTPPFQTIDAGSTVLFHCKLELDERIIRAGCENDQRFTINAWRQDPESSARWGGVEYEIRPREKTEAALTGSWDYSKLVSLDGKITPDPGGGVVHIRVDFQNHQARWVTTSLAPGGHFSWNEIAPADSFMLEGTVWFEGNRKFGSSRSQPIKVSAPPVIH